MNLFLVRNIPVRLTSRGRLLANFQSGKPHIRTHWNYVTAYKLTHFCNNLKPGVRLLSSSNDGKKSAAYNNATVNTSDTDKPALTIYPYKIDFEKLAADRAKKIAENAEIVASISKTTVNTINPKFKVFKSVKSEVDVKDIESETKITSSFGGNSINKSDAPEPAVENLILVDVSEKKDGKKGALKLEKEGSEWKNPKILLKVEENSSKKKTSTANDVKIPLDVVKGKMRNIASNTEQIAPNGDKTPMNTSEEKIAKIEQKPIFNEKTQLKVAKKKNTAKANQIASSIESIETAKFVENNANATTIVATEKFETKTEKIRETKTIDTDVIPLNAPVEKITKMFAKAEQITLSDEKKPFNIATEKITKKAVKTEQIAFTDEKMSLKVAKKKSTAKVSQIASSNEKLGKMSIEKPEEILGAKAIDAVKNIPVASFSAETVETAKIIENTAKAEKLPSTERFEKETEKNREIKTIDVDAIKCASTAPILIETVKKAKIKPIESAEQKPIQKQSFSSVLSTPSLSATAKPIEFCPIKPKSISTNTATVAQGFEVQFLYYSHWFSSWFQFNFG